MDKEADEALNMTKDEVVVRWEAGRPADVARRKDVAQTMRGVVDRTIARSEEGDAPIRLVVVGTKSLAAGDPIRIDEFDESAELTVTTVNYEFLVKG